MHIHVHSCVCHVLIQPMFMHTLIGTMKRGPRLEKWPTSPCGLRRLSPNSCQPHWPRLARPCLPGVNQYALVSI